MPYTYEYPRPALTVDCIIFAYAGPKKLQVLLIERAHAPFEGHWALPGGFVDMDEDLETAALRELQEETGVTKVYIEQLYTFGAPKRDPRGRVVSVAYYALVNPSLHPVKAASDAKNVQWFPVDNLPPLAFDHDEVLQIATNRLQAKVRYQPIGFELLPTTFTLTQLQELYETILGLNNPEVQLNKRNFRTRILKMGVLEEAGKQRGVAHRPATLYRFNREKYPELLKAGFDFDI